MNYSQGVLEYKCPCCGAGLAFGEEVQQMHCEYCDNTFEVEAVLAYNDTLDQEDHCEIQFDGNSGDSWDESEQAHMRVFVCPSCGGELITDANTAATFCPYCENPAIIEARLSGGIRPAFVIPFQKSKEDAQKAFLSLCKGKKLLPKMFTEKNRIEKITGIYVPFWLYSCSGTVQANFRGTILHSWVDSQYRYVKTDHYLLSRTGNADFTNIPIDASRKMDDEIMESIEPFDFGQLTEFNSAYLSGFYADKYDVDAEEGKNRISQRVDNTMDSLIQSSLMGYSGLIPSGRNVNVEQKDAKYVLLPVWMLHTKYEDKTYVFAMNGQTGKMTGTFPICPKRSAGWFAGITAIGTAIAGAIQLLFS